MWGTCLGFEELSYLVSGELLLTNTDTKEVTLPLNFSQGKNSLSDPLRNVSWAGLGSSKYQVKSARDIYSFLNYLLRLEM